MRVLTLRSCQARNIHCHRPVICMQVDLEQLSGLETKAIPGFNDRLLRHLPTLAEHHCAQGCVGGFLTRLREGTMFGHLLEHVALELQHLASIPVYYGKTRHKQGSVYDIVFECDTAQAGEKAARAAVDIVSELLAGSDVDIEKYVADIRLVHSSECVGPTTKAIAEAANRVGIPVLHVTNSLLQLGYGRYARRTWAMITDRTSCLAADIASDKMLTKRLLGQAGIPVPKGGVVSDEQLLPAMVEQLGLPVVLKPCNGNQGKGVALNLDDMDEILAACRLARKFSDRVIIEQFIPGLHYRLLVIDGRVVAASHRIPAHVIGDGQSTVMQLVDETNRDRMRGEGHERPLTKIRIDPIVHMVLRRQQLTLDDVPARGQVVFLRQNANLSTGGIAVDVTDEVCEENRRLAERATEVIGLDVAGVDVVAPDISQPITDHCGAVIEVNAAPGIRMHLHPSYGKPRPVGDLLIAKLFGPSPQRIPVVAVTGTNGKTTTARLAKEMLAQAGFEVGLATTDGVFIGGEQVAAGDMAGPEGTKMVLMDSRVEAAVLEIARGGLVRSGLAYDLADVAIITNVADDHIGQNGIKSLTDLIHAKSLVAEAVRQSGAVVLNADDAAAPLIAERARATIIYVAMSAENPIAKAHLDRGGRAVSCSDGWLTLHDQAGMTRLLDIKRVPLSHGGVCEASISNVMCATAAAWHLGLDQEAIVRTLMEFKPDLDGNHGRFNVIEAGGVRVLIDYGHNPPAITAAGKLARVLAGRGRLIGVIGVPGDRTDQQIVASGQAAAPAFDRLIIKEDSDLRGRQPGEVARLLAVGAKGLSPELPIEIVLDEQAAVEAALLSSAPGDTVVVFYERIGPVLAAIDSAVRPSEDKLLVRQ